MNQLILVTKKDVNLTKTGLHFEIGESPFIINFTPDALEELFAQWDTSNAIIKSRRKEDEQLLKITFDHSHLQEEKGKVMSVLNEIEGVVQRLKDLGVVVNIRNL